MVGGVNLQHLFVEVIFQLSNLEHLSYHTSRPVGHHLQYSSIDTQIQLLYLKHGMGNSIHAMIEDGWPCGAPDLDSFLRINSLIYTREAMKLH